MYMCRLSLGHGKKVALNTFSDISDLFLMFWQVFYYFFNYISFCVVVTWIFTTLMTKWTQTASIPIYIYPENLWYSEYTSITTTCFILDFVVPYCTLKIYLYILIRLDWLLNVYKVILLLLCAGIIRILYSRFWSFWRQVWSFILIKYKQLKWEDLNVLSQQRWGPTHQFNTRTR